MRRRVDFRTRNRHFAHVEYVNDAMGNAAIQLAVSFFDWLAQQKDVGKEEGCILLVGFGQSQSRLDRRANKTIFFLIVFRTGVELPFLQVGNLLAAERPLEQKVGRGIQKVVRLPLERHDDRLKGLQGV